VHGCSTRAHLLRNPHGYQSAHPLSNCMQQHQQRGHAAFRNVFSTSLSATRMTPCAAHMPCAAQMHLKAFDIPVSHHPLCLCRAESSYGFDPSSVGMSEKEAANIALAFGQVSPAGTSSLMHLPVVRLPPWPVAMAQCGVLHHLHPHIHMLPIGGVTRGGGADSHQLATHSAIRRTRLQGARGKASPARYA
jgi:hypothetical protein